MDTSHDIRYHLFHKFEKELNNLGGSAFMLKREELAPKLGDILSKGSKNLVIYETPLLKDFISKNSLSKNTDLHLHWLPEKRPADLDAINYRRMLLEADTGIVACDYLLADSGTVVLLGAHHQSQLATLLPSTLIVIATTPQIVENINTFHKILSENHRESNSSILYIAGPSRTADIEKTLILGVHGPKELHVFVIKGD